jgi:hypothetical protein
MGVKAIKLWRQRAAVAVEWLRVAGCAWLRSSGYGRGALLQQAKPQRRVGPRSVAQIRSGTWFEQWQRGSRLTLSGGAGWLPPPFDSIAAGLLPPPSDSGDGEPHSSPI